MNSILQMRIKLWVFFYFFPSIVLGGFQSFESLCAAWIIPSAVDRIKPVNTYWKRVEVWRWFLVMLIPGCDVVRLSGALHHFAAPFRFDADFTRSEISSPLNGLFTDHHRILAIIRPPKKQNKTSDAENGNATKFRGLEGWSFLWLNDTSTKP